MEENRNEKLGEEQELTPPVVNKELHVQECGAFTARLCTKQIRMTEVISHKNSGGILVIFLGAK